MPIYQCWAPDGAIRPDLRLRIAEELTRVHCQVTGDASDFAQMIFFEIPAGSSFLNGRDSPMVNVAGYLRAGRSPDLREELFRRIHSLLTHLAGIHPEHIKITLFDVPTNWIMQDGRMMPEIGQDQEWLAQGRLNK